MLAPLAAIMPHQINAAEAARKGGKMDRTVVDCFRELPEAHAIPESVWDCYKLRVKINELRAEISLLEIDLSVAANKMLSDLSRDWSLNEIDATGIRDCI